MCERLKIAVVTPIPTPYRDPFWNSVAGRGDVELDVFYCSGGKADRPWTASWKMDYHAEVLRGHNLLRWRGVDASCYWNPAILQRLAAKPYDAVVVGGYNHLTMLAAILDSVRRGRPYFLMCESYQRRSAGNLKRWMKDGLVRQVIGRATGGFPTGRLAREYLVGYGADPARLAFVPNVPDVARIKEKVAALRLDRDALRKKHGLSVRPVILFIGRFIPKKRADCLIRAFQASGLAAEADLVLVGDGPQRPELEALAQQPQLRGRVHFAGFVEPEEMTTWLAMANLFVLPSSETWGVVVLESLAAGLPVIITDEVGCGPDVLNDPRVGEAVPAGSVPALAVALRGRIGNPVEASTVDDVWRPVYERMLYPDVAERMIETIGRWSAPREDNTKLERACSSRIL